MRGITAAGLGLLAASTIGAPAATAAAGTPSDGQAPARYAKVKQVCPPAGPRSARCLALALVPAAPGAAGSHAYQLAAGALARGPAGGLTPSDLAGAYGYTPAAGGTGQTVGIVDAYDDPAVEEDLGAFDSQYGLPACTKANGCFRKVSQTGSTTALPAADTAGWSVEISLDVETVHSVCPNCSILLVEAGSESVSDLAASANEAVSLGATEVSNSYGEAEASLGAGEQAAYDHPGVVITASAGDSGYLNWDDIFSLEEYAPAPDAPASLPTVVAVGGTALKLASTGRRSSESVWNDSGRPSDEREFKQLAATGGGCSTVFPAPSWQQDVPGWSNAACAGKRLDNDIAADADPYTGFDIYDTYVYESSFKPGWLTVGGTSLSSPLISSLYALAGGAHGVSYPAATLYTHLGQAASLYDVTKGGSGYCDGEEAAACGEPEVNELLGEVDCLGTSACDAATGYDGPTGVGTPNGLTAFGGVTPVRPTVLTEAATALTPSTATLNATVNPNGSTVSSCTFEYGPTISYGQSAACTPAPGSATSPVQVTAAITGLAAKTTYHFRVTATDSAGTSVGRAKTLRTTKTT